MYLNSGVIIPLWIIGIAIVAAGREKGGERGLLLAALAVGTLVAILIALNPGSGGEGYELLGGAWIGAVLGLLILRKIPIWRAFIFAVVLSVAIVENEDVLAHRHAAGWISPVGPGASLGF